MHSRHQLFLFALMAAIIMAIVAGVFGTQVRQIIRVNAAQTLPGR